MRVRRLRAASAAVLIGSVGALALVTTAPGAGAGIEEVAAPLTVVKTVSGPVPAGTTFTATIQCNDDIILVQGGESTDHATVTFGADGQPTSPDTVSFVDAGTCTVTETANGGAATTTYECEGSVPETPTTSTTTTTEVVPKSTGFGGRSQAVTPEDPICPAAGPQSQPVSVNIEVENQVATVTIHNTFNTPAVQPAAVVAATPTFTG
jgi:hypothetical protein